MSSRVYPKLTTTSIPPADSKLGDQYYDPVANQLYELVPVNGTTVSWVQIPLVLTGNLYSGNIVFAAANSITFGDGTIQTTAGSSVANTIYLSGVQTTQNANITAAFAKANTGVANIGPVITVNSAGYLFVSNTTVSTSNTTGALVVSGGVGVAGNIYTTGVITVNNSVTIANTQTTNTASMIYNASLNSIDFIFN